MKSWIVHESLKKGTKEAINHTKNIGQKVKNKLTKKINWNHFIPLKKKWLEHYLKIPVKIFWDEIIRK